MLRRLSYKAVKSISGRSSSGHAVQWRVSGVQGLYVPEHCSSGTVRSPSAVRNGARALWQFGNDETGHVSIAWVKPSHWTRPARKLL